MELGVGFLEQLEWAAVFWEANKERLARDRKLGTMLKAYRTAYEQSAEIRMTSGVWLECGRCEEFEGGSCCGAGIEERYDKWMLLINMLLGVSIPRTRISENSCLFLGASGCLLAARDVLCVNYLCAKIQGRCRKDALERLQEAEGRELLLLFNLHEYIKERFGRRQ